MQSLPDIPKPEQCALWRNEPSENIHETLEAIETYVDNSHDRRCLLKCHECEQLYFYHFLEFVDYERGEDPQYRTYIPVTSAEDAAMLSGLPERDIAECAPAIHSDWPKGQDRPAIFWVGRRKPE
jgi:hypothetical protein